MRIAYDQCVSFPSPEQVGAVLTETLAGVDGSKRILATGRNNVERTSDASAHAEMLCLQVSRYFALRMIQPSARFFVRFHVHSLMWQTFRTPFRFLRLPAIVCLPLHAGGGKGTR